MWDQFTVWAYETALAIYFLIPVGLFGLWRWTVWLARKLIGLRYRSYEPGQFSPTVSLVIPVYNEDPDVFLEALNSWARANPDEIIAVIDHSDKDCVEVFRNFARQTASARLIITKKPGKRPALVDGIQVATSDIVALVDSDTLWEDGILPKLVIPFEDPAVGGVSTRQNVLEPKTLAQKLFDIHLDSRYFEEIRFLAAAGDALTCISGRTAVYRRSAVLPILDDLLNEKFFGRPVISGDDKRLTHLIQAAGWRVRYQENARVFTPGSPKMKSFLKQRLRWSRNSWRADLRALYDGWAWKKPALAAHLVDRIVQPITTLVGPIYFLIALYRQNWTIALVLFIWWFISRGIKILPHLKREPSDVFILPAYIFYSYIFALFKIFAFFTMNHQGWITRWDSSRLGGAKKLKLLPAYGATMSVVFFLGIGILRVDSVNQAFIYERRFFQSEVVLPGYDFDLVNDYVGRVTPPETFVGATAVAEGLAPYKLRLGDTQEQLAQKYGLDPDAILNPSNTWTVGQDIFFQLPFKEYAPYRQQIAAQESAHVTYIPSTNTIIVAGHGSAVDIPTLHEALGQDSIIVHEGNGVYFLKANILLERHTTLLLEAPALSWLKLKSDINGFVTIKSVGGSLNIDGVRVSSWDTTRGDFDHEYADGRSYILIRDARMDILNADVGYLGHPLGAADGGGGVYGLSWRIANETRFGEELVTGIVENSAIHHNYFGVYTFGATGMVIRNNEVYENVQYGIDPHDDSNNFIVEHNYVHDNGNHGIIFSRRCFNNVIRWNRSENNRLHGIMLDRTSNQNSVYQNVLLHNVDGVALWDSHNNAIFDNQVFSNKRGIRANHDSSNNHISENQIANSLQYGIYLYDDAHTNQVLGNRMEDNEVGIYIKSIGNYIVENQVSGSVQAIYLTRGARGNQILRNRLIQNQTGIYLKTRPNDFVLGNVFEDNRNNVEISQAWRLVSVEQLTAQAAEN